MAKLAVLFTVICLLFTFSHARFFTSEPEPFTDLPETNPESTTAITLPSERPDFEPSKLLDFKHDDDVVAASETDSDSGVGSVPLKKISFHPVNRHFPRSPVFPYRHSRHRNCRFNKRFRPLNPRFHQKRFVSYGNDMILSDERSFDPASRGVVRQIEARWGSFHDDGSESKHHHHDQDQKHEHEHHDQEHEHEHEHEHHDQEHELHHEDEHHRHQHHHKNHHHHGEDEKDQQENGFMDKFRNLFIHF